MARKRRLGSGFGKPTIEDWFSRPFLSHRKRRRRGDKNKGGVPVEPNNPKNLSGGAAAALEFDDEQ